MKKSILTQGFVWAAILGLPLLSGCVMYRDRPVYVQPAPAVTYAPPAPAATVVVGDPVPPPVPVEVIPPAPNPAFVWVGGNWEWRGHWVWIRGHWGARPRPGAVWVRGGWVHRGHQRVWVVAHWR